MTTTSYVVSAVVALVTFLALDMVWLGLAASGIYQDLLGTMLAQPPRKIAATAFYLVFTFGLLHFVVWPGVRHGDLSRVLIDGALFGLVTYATFDLTSRAVFRDFPQRIVPIDIAWGIFLATAVSATSVLITRRFT